MYFKRPGYRGHTGAWRVGRSGVRQFKSALTRRTRSSVRRRFRPRGATGTVYGRARGYFRTAGYYGRFSGPGAIELKFHDLDVDDAAIAAGATIAEDSCNTIAQGVTEVTRIGRKCTIRQIGWKWNIKLPVTAPATGAQSDTVRVILYIDKQCNGATAATTGILETADYQSFNNLANKSRFRTLMDRTYTLNVQAASGDGAANDISEYSIDDSFYKKCNIPIEFDSTTGAITEVRSNNIGVMLVGKNGLAVFESKMRLRFSDSG